MQTRTSLVAALVATAGLSSIALGAVHAESADTSSHSAAGALPTTAPVPPTCTCPPQPTAQPTVPQPTGPLPPTTGPGAPTGPTVPAVPSGAVTTTALQGVPTTAPGGVAPVAGSALPADASLEQLQAAIEPMFGPTTDVMAEFAIFGVTPPAGVPTPAGAEIDTFKFALDSIADPEDAYYRGIAVITSTQPAAELVTLYQTGLVAAGFTQTGDSVEQTDSGRQIRWLEYTLPGSTHFMAEFAVGIVDDDVDFVQIEWSDGVVNGAALAAPFTSWTGLPLVDQAVLLEDAEIGNFLAYDTNVTVSTGYRVPIEYAQLESQFLAALPSTPYTLDAESSQAGDWAALTGGPFGDMTVYFTEGYVEGTSELNVDAYYERQP